VVSVVEYSNSFFFFQAEDGIRDKLVTGVQTCALPIFLLDLLLGVVGVEVEVAGGRAALLAVVTGDAAPLQDRPHVAEILNVEREIGRASCRGRVWGGGGVGARKVRAEMIGRLSCLMEM